MIRAVVVAAQVGELLPQPSTGHAFQAVDQSGENHLGWEGDERVDVIGFTVELHDLAFEVGCHFAHRLFHSGRVCGGEDWVPIFGSEDQVCMQRENAMPAGANVGCLAHRPMIEWDCDGGASLSGTRVLCA